MLGKILYNIFLNIAVILMGLSIVWGFNHKNYAVMVVAIAVLAILIYLKIRLIKMIKTATSKPK